MIKSDAVRSDVEIYTYFLISGFKDLIHRQLQKESIYEVITISI